MGIRAVINAPDWSPAHHRGEAKCRDHRLTPTRDNDVFFNDEALAMDICNGIYDGVVCPRRADCLHVAMVNREGYGIWGGMTARDRLALRMRNPGTPERWTWHPPSEAITTNFQESQWPAAS
ncbi:WhiB family transcriptional regulator [Streptomyces sp. MMBL 11-1]|uniref:WhiB family transcriptional regulator n=1 Tax=Streptomyces sp. MMBL 11-1 TaxID=3026420 RepID=UPI0023601DDA|nr:WhiB family transcriptional regulator [Streptomyces sp. MMBL 11-1]